MALPRELAAVPPHLRAAYREAQRVHAQARTMESAARQARRLEASTELRKKTRLVRKLAPIAFSRPRQAPICSQRKRVLTPGQDSRRRLDRRLGCGRPAVRRSSRVTRAGPSEDGDSEPPGSGAPGGITSRTAGLSPHFSRPWRPQTEALYRQLVDGVPSSSTVGTPVVVQLELDLEKVTA
jgi:hypothetical protein